MNCNRTRPLMFLLPLALTVSVQARADVQESDFSLETTRDLYDICSSAEGSDKHIPAIYACRGFMEGAVQYHDAVSERKDAKRLICYPPTATLADARTTFTAWAEDNADDAKLMGEAPVVGLVRALSAKYPCSN